MKRFVFSDNAVLNDYSFSMEDYNIAADTIDYTAGQDSIYIGSFFPFNSLYFKVSTANDQASVVSIDYWGGQQWESVVDVIDETALSGVSLAQSGHITWTPDKHKAWVRDDTVDTTGGESITGLGNVTVYDLYWVKIDFSASLNALTALKWVGPMFCSDNDIYSEFPYFSDNTFKTGFLSGKTDWEEQRVSASRLIVDDLINKAVISSGDQLLERRLFRSACVSKSAQIVFNALGDDYVDDATRALSEYGKRLKKANYGADNNNDARLSVKEKGVRQGGLYR